MKNVQVSVENWEYLMRKKIDTKAKNVDAVITELIKIVEAQKSEQ